MSLNHSGHYDDYSDNYVYHEIRLVSIETI